MDTTLYNKTLQYLPLKQRFKIAKEIRQKQVENYLKFISSDPPEAQNSKKRNDKKAHLNVKFCIEHLVQGAIETGDDLQVLKLVKKGFDPNFATGNGVSLLHKCCTEGNAIVAEILISLGANVNIKDDDWWTPLHIACHLDNTDLVQLLLHNEAEASILDVDGNFPIDHAPVKSESYNLMAAHLEKKGLDSKELSQLRSAAGKYVRFEIQSFIEHGVDVSKPLFDGITWLHIVCANGYKKAFKLLLDNKADVNAVDLNGWTPLHVAAKFNQKLVVEILLKCNARTDIAGIHGFRPVDVAATEEIQKLIDDQRRRKQSSVTSETDFEEIEEDDAFISKTVRPPELPLPKAEKLMEAQIRAQYLDDVPARKKKMSDHESEKSDFDYISTILKVQPSEEGILPSTGPSDDLTHLATLTEKHILEILQERFKYNKIYTNIGDILIAVNPLQTLPYYSKQICQMYQNAEILRRLPPHIYSNAEHALREMRASGQSQCCVIGGESGSGKTESCKFIVQHLIEASKCQDVDLLHKIHQINPLLEAFGNAQTLMNYNSSRYAKYLELKYCQQGKKLLGASLKEYLLEKSRVVNHGNNELNYHIFYWMMAGLTVEECHVNMIDKKQPYRYLGKDFSKQMTIENKQKFWEVKECLKFIGFSSEVINSVVTIVAAILHLGNITFIPVDDGRAKIDNVEPLKKVSSLLCILYDDLVSALVEDVLITRGEHTQVYLTVPQATAGTDALAKSLYSRLFSWIVNGINQFVQPDEESSENTLSISIIDLFGFENLQHNSFEQMCINVANEKLQIYFNQQVFQQEFDDCKAEGLKHTALQYSNNDTVISLFLDKTCSIMSVLDEECSFPKASDRSLASKLHQGPGEKYKKIYKSPRDGGPSFNIFHYAGTINYSLEGVLEKNRDKLRPYLTTTMKSSTKLIFRELFQTRLSTMGSLQTSVRQISMKKKPGKSAMGLTKIVHRVKGMKPGKPVTKRPPATMAYHFRNSLNDLMIKLSSSKPHFIRCISPNTLKQPSLFVPSHVQVQLNYTGILQTVKIRKSGFAVRMKFTDFLQRYNYLQALRISGNKKPSVESARCKQILDRWKVEGYQIGKTKVFLHQGYLEKLDSINGYFHRMVIKAQAVVRGCFVRRKMRLRFSKRERDASHVEILTNHVNRQQTRIYKYQTDLVKFDLETARLQIKDEEEDALQALDDVFEDEAEYGCIWEFGASSVDNDKTYVNSKEIDENFQRYSLYLTPVKDPEESAPTGNPANDLKLEESLPSNSNPANNLELEEAPPSRCSPANDLTTIFESGTHFENQMPTDQDDPRLYKSIKDENQNKIPPPNFLTAYYVNLPHHGRWAENRHSGDSSIKPEDSISQQERFSRNSQSDHSSIKPDESITIREQSDEYEVPVNSSESEQVSMNQFHGQTYAAMDGVRNFPPSPRQMYSGNNTYEEMSRHNGSAHRSLEKIPPVLPARSPDTRLSNSTGTSSRGSSISEHDNISYADSHYSTPSPPMSPGKKHHQSHYGAGQTPYSYVPNSSVLQQQLQNQELYSRAEGLYDTYIHNDDHLVQQSAYGQSPQNQKHMQIGKSVKKMASPVLTHKMHPFQNGPNGTQGSPKLRRASEADANHQSMKVKGKNVGSPKLPLKFHQKSASIDCGQSSVPPPPSFPAPPPPLHVQERYNGNNPRCPSPPLPPPPPEFNQGSPKKPPGMPPPPPPVSTIPGRQSRPQEVSGYQSPRSTSHSRSSSSVGSVESSAAIIQEIGQVKLKTRHQSGTNGNVVSTDNSSSNELSKIQLKKTKTEKIGDIYQEKVPQAEPSPTSSISSLTAGIVPICDIDDFPLPPPPEELLSSIPPPVVQPAYSQSAGVQRQNSGVHQALQRQNSGVQQQYSDVHQALQRQNSGIQQQTPASNGVNRYQGVQTPSSPVNKISGTQSPFGAQNHQPSSPITNKKFPSASAQSPVAKQPPQTIPKVPSAPVLPKSQVAPPSEPMIPKVPAMSAVGAKSQGIPSAPPVPKSPTIAQTSNGTNGHLVTIGSINVKMDFEVPADIDLSQCPDLVPTPRNCPVWKKEMIDKKNKDKVEEYVRDILRGREEEKKWKDVPEWKRKVLKQKSEEARAKEKAVKEGKALPPDTSDKPCSQKELLHAGQSHHDDDFVPAAMNIDPEEFESMPPWKQELLTKRKNIPVTFNNEFNPDEEEEAQPQNYDLDVKMAS